MILYRILCWVRRDHHYFKEVFFDKNITRNYCKCGKWLEFDWSYSGGYHKSISDVSSLIRKRKWENTDKENGLGDKN